MTNNKNRITHRWTYCVCVCVCDGNEERESRWIIQVNCKMAKVVLKVAHFHTGNKYWLFLTPLLKMTNFSLFTFSTGVICQPHELSRWWFDDVCISCVYDFFQMKQQQTYTSYVIHMKYKFVQDVILPLARKTVSSRKKQQQQLLSLEERDRHKVSRKLSYKLDTTAQLMIENWGIMIIICRYRYSNMIAS